LAENQPNKHSKQLSSGGVRPSMKYAGLTTNFRNVLSETAKIEEWVKDSPDESVEYQKACQETEECNLQHRMKHGQAKREQPSAEPTIPLGEKIDEPNSATAPQDWATTITVRNAKGLRALRSKLQTLTHVVVYFKTLGNDNFVAPGLSLDLRSLDQLECITFKDTTGGKVRFKGLREDPRAKNRIGLALPERSGLKVKFLWMTNYKSRKYKYAGLTSKLRRTLYGAVNVVEELVNDTLGAEECQKKSCQEMETCKLHHRNKQVKENTIRRSKDDRRVLEMDETVGLKESAAVDVDMKTGDMVLAFSKVKLDRIVEFEVMEVADARTTTPYYSDDTSFIDDKTLELCEEDRDSTWKKIWEEQAPDAMKVEMQCYDSATHLGPKKISRQ
jgi:hypothetical protein